MKRIAIGIPSYNESGNIAKITKIIDKGLYSYNLKGYDTVIVNCDNNSDDGTSDVFLSTETKCSKYSIINKKVGKGVNVLSFFKFCFTNEIDYAITLDADLISIQSNWIKKFLEPLLNEGFDYVTPIYKRSRYEGSTTNHFAFPIVYAVTGTPIRQPIAGDFAFNSKFIRLVSKYGYNNAVETYGIDIYMTLIAAANKLNIKQILLDKKIHNPSYNKIEGMFQQVLDATIFTLSVLRKEGKLGISKHTEINTRISMCRTRKFNHKKQAIGYLNKYKIDSINLENEWLRLLSLLINGEEVDKEYLFRVFMYRASLYWLRFERLSAYNCEEKVWDFAYKLLKKGGFYGKNNN